ncbi:MAG: transposase, partial [bacterium]
MEAYLTRWRVEETIRFIKQSYELLDIRVLGYDSIRNLAMLVFACVYFAAVWLERKAKLK